MRYKLFFFLKIYCFQMWSLCTLYSHLRIFLLQKQTEEILELNTFQARKMAISSTLLIRFKKGEGVNRAHPSLLTVT